MFTSSFEAELDGVTRGLKSQSRVSNILGELRILTEVPVMWSDDKAMVTFIHGEGEAKSRSSYGALHVVCSGALHRS